MQPDHLDREIDANYDFFRRHLAELLRDQPRRFVLLKNQSVIGFFDTVTDAARHGRENYPDGLFSVQEVMEEPIDLGFSPMPVVSFTHDRAQILITVAILPPEDAPDPTRMRLARGLIDTGAVSTGIIPTITTELQLPRLGKTIIATPGGDYTARRFQFRIGLFPDPRNENSFPHVLPDELLGIGCSPGQAFEVLIGMDVLGRGDLEISRKGYGSFTFL